jgi:TetR/AcrR family transcriptional regulator
VKRPRVMAKEQRSREILDAAKEVFFEKGFKNAAMESIAYKAGVSKGTVYFYFKTKEDLYMSMMMPVLEELGRQLLEFEQSTISGAYTSCDELVRAMFELLWRVYQFDPDGIRIVQAFQQGDHFSEMSDSTLLKINDRARLNYQIMRRSFSRAIEAGILKHCDAIKLSDVIWATFIGIIQVEISRLRATKRDHLYETLKFSFKVMADGICRS